MFKSSVFEMFLNSQLSGSTKAGDCGQFYINGARDFIEESSENAPDDDDIEDSISYAMGQSHIQSFCQGIMARKNILLNTRHEGLYVTDVLSEFWRNYAGTKTKPNIDSGYLEGANDFIIYYFYDSFSLRASEGEDGYLIGVINAKLFIKGCRAMIYLLKNSEDSNIDFDSRLLKNFSIF